LKEIIDAKKTASEKEAPVDEYFDCALLYGAELKNPSRSPLSDKSAREAILKTTNGFNDDSCEEFTKRCDFWQDYEVTKKIKNSFSSKKYLGSWSFCMCLDTDMQCDECDSQPENMRPINGAVYLTYVKPYVSSEENRNSEREEPSSGKDDSIWSDCKVVLVDIIFLDVPRELIGNLFDTAQHSKLMLKSINRSSSAKEWISLVKLLEQYNIHIVTMPKSIVSGCSTKPIAGEEMIYLLTHDSKTESMKYSLDCEKNNKYCEENISNYKESHIVISDCCIIQQFYTDRIDVPAYGRLRPMGRYSR